MEILKPYRLISSVNNEFDLWLRIMMTYMTSSIHLGQRNEALHIEKELYIQLSSKLFVRMPSSKMNFQIPPPMG